MSPSQANEERSGNRIWLLNDEEERALSTLRDIVARLRASLPAVGVAALEEAIRAAGGRRVHSSEEEGPDTFLMGGARFTIRPSHGTPGKFEVNFIPISP